MSRPARAVSGVVVAAVLIAFLATVSSSIALWVLLAATAALLAWYWVTAVVDLLRTGPGEESAWWAGTLAVVVLLGPIGAFAYRVARPHFANHSSHRL